MMIQEDFSRKTSLFMTDRQKISRTLNKITKANTKASTEPRMAYFENLLSAQVEFISKLNRLFSLLTEK